MDEIYDDDSKRRNFLSGLETIIEAGSYTPITQASSPIAKLAKGQKKGMLAAKALELQESKALTDRIKALNTGKDRRYRPVEEEFIFKGSLIVCVNNVNWDKNEDTRAVIDRVIYYRLRLYIVLIYYFYLVV